MIDKFSPLFLAFCLGIFLMTAASHSSWSAPAMKHDTCRITGVITSLEEIEFERNQPDSWIRDWGLSKKYSEIKIDLDVTSMEILDDLPMDQTSCTLEKAEQGYYLKNKSTLKKFLTDFDVGDCITAETNFSGDEFRIGNWIYNIKTRSVEQCDTTGKTEDKTE